MHVQTHPRRVVEFRIFGRVLGIRDKNLEAIGFGSVEEDDVRSCCTCTEIFLSTGKKVQGRRAGVVQVVTAVLGTKREGLAVVW